MKKYTPYIIVAVVVAVIVLIVLFAKKTKANNREVTFDPITGKPVQGPANSDNNTCVASFTGKPSISFNPLFPLELDTAKILKCGDYGNEVAALQYYIGADSDGKFGNQTKQALLSKFGKSEIRLAEVMAAYVGQFNNQNLG